MNITRAGLGSFALGGADWRYGWGEQDDKDSIAAIRHAIDSGLNWIDTAAAYGLGLAEKLVARALRDFPRADRPYVFTKCGMEWDDDNPLGPIRQIGAPASLRRGLEASLRRLEVERIDLLQMHWPPGTDQTPLEVYWQTLLDMKKEGKIGAVGLSNHDVAQLEAAERLGHVDTLQPPFSAIHREVGAAELSWCAQHNTGVIVYSPMQAGLLTGTFSAARAAALPANDWRARSPDFTGEALQRNLALADALRPVALRRGVTQGAVAAAWTLAWPGVTAAILGARRPAQLDGWISVATLELSPADLNEIADAIAATGAGFGPATPALEA
jgi:aryl-alcohol dehydrogenase-like predicted oxidoreductase